MEEKKLTDEEIIKELINKSNRGEWCEISFINCVEVRVLKNAIDLIHRLQEHNGNEVRMRCDMQRKFDDLQNLCIEQKAEIERLTEENKELEKTVNDMSWIIKIHKYCVGANHCQNRSDGEFELQKQVDELKEKIMNLKSAMIDRVARKSYDSLLTMPEDVEEIFGDAYESEFNKFLGQTVKDTAKEILQEVSKHYGGAWLVELYKRYGVSYEENN